MKYSDEDVLRKVGRLVTKLGRIPQWAEFNREPGIKDSTMRLRFGNLFHAAQLAQKKGYCPKSLALAPPPPATGFKTVRLAVLFWHMVPKSRSRIYCPGF